MIDQSALFPASAAITPSAPESSRADFAHIPAKPAVYLLTTDLDSPNPELRIPNLELRTPNSHPLLLATVGDLRAALKRRLADNPPDAKTKRVPYGTLCTRVYYRIVYSALAANYYYAQAARALFPQTAAALIPWHTSWWIAVEHPGPVATPFPRFRKTNNLSDPTLAYAGPIRDKHAAQRLVESLEDLFDLCRYHHILIQAPHGKACAYKEMGKCPAPCDGSVSLASYREQIDAALAFVTDTQPRQTQGLQSLGVDVQKVMAQGLVAPSPRAAWRDKLEQHMKSAATQLHFETAARIKQRLSRAGLLDTEPFTPTARLEDFAFLTLQPGKGKPWIEPWLIHFAPRANTEISNFRSQISNFKFQIPDIKSQIPNFKSEISNQKSNPGAPGENPLTPLPQFHIKQLPAAAAQLARQCRQLAPFAPSSLTPDQTLHAALIAHHLFKGDSDHGIWLRLAAAQDPAAIIHAAEALRARKAPKPLAEQSTDAAPVAEKSAESPPVAGLEKNEPR